MVVTLWSWKGNHGMVESNSCLLLGLWLTSPASCLCLHQKPEIAPPCTVLRTLAVPLPLIVTGDSSESCRSLQGASLSSGAVPLPVAYEVTVQNESVDVRLSEESSDSSPTSPAFPGTGRFHALAAGVGVRGVECPLLCGVVGRSRENEANGWFGVSGLSSLPCCDTVGQVTVPFVWEFFSAQQRQQPFYGPLSGTTLVSWYQKKHSPTHHPDHHPVFISFFHLPRSITYNCTTAGRKPRDTHLTHVHLDSGC